MIKKFNVPTLCLFMTFFLAWTADCQNLNILARVSFLIGKAQWRTENSNTWSSLKLSQKVSNGDWIKTDEEETVELKLIDGSIVRISEKAEVVISGQVNRSFKANIKSGKVWGNIKKLSQKNEDFEISTGTAVAAIRGTVFNTQKNESDSSTTVAVYDGKVDVGPDKALKDTMEAAKKRKAEGGMGVREEISGPIEVPGPYEVSLEDWVSIVAGMQINIRPDGRYDKREIDKSQEAVNAWVNFNMKRDKDLREKDER